MAYFPPFFGFVLLDVVSKMQVFHENMQIMKDLFNFVDTRKARAIFTVP